MQAQHNIICELLSTHVASTQYILYLISDHLAACQYNQGLPETCLSDCGNDFGGIARGNAGNSSLAKV